MDNNQLLQVKQALDEAIAQKKLSQELLKNLGPAVIETLRPVLDEIAKNAKLSKEELLNVLSQIKIDTPKVDVPQTEVKVTIPDIVIPEPKVTVNVDAPKIPEIKIPKIIVPEPKVTVNVPPIKIPDLQWPKDKMPIEGWVQLMGVSLQNPLPVQIRDANGKPVDFAGNITQVMGGGGGKADFFTIKGFGASAFADYLNADGRLRVSVETGGSGLTDNELRATAVPVAQVSGASWSTEATIVGTVPVSATDLDIRDLNIAQDEVLAHQVSGSMWSSEASGVARTTNPTAISDGASAKFSTDDLGRQLVRPVQVRDLIYTAYVSKASGSTFGTETTLLAATAGAMFDLIYVMGSNDSDAAISCDIRGVTAGGVLMNIRIPANGTAGVATPVPIPQTSSDTGNAWTIDLPDVTGTNISISALFSREI